MTSLSVVHTNHSFGHQIFRCTKLLETMSTAQLYAAKLRNLGRAKNAATISGAYKDVHSEEHGKKLTIAQNTLREPGQAVIRQHTLLSHHPVCEKGNQFATVWKNRVAVLTDPQFADDNGTLVIIANASDSMRSCVPVKIESVAFLSDFSSVGHKPDL